MNLDSVIVVMLRMNNAVSIEHRSGSGDSLRLLLLAADGVAGSTEADVICLRKFSVLSRFMNALVVCLIAVSHIQKYRTLTPGQGDVAEQVIAFPSVLRTARDFAGQFSLE